VPIMIAAEQQPEVLHGSPIAPAFQPAQENG
jgi:hypothetical protein